MKEGLYHLDVNDAAKKLKSSNIGNIFCNSVLLPPSALWHFRFGHASLNKTSSLQRFYPSIELNKNMICDVCKFARQKRKSFPTSINRASKIFGLLHMDLWGPFAVDSIHGYKYFLTILDDHSRFTWVILIKGKHETQMHIQNFITMVQNQFGVAVKRIRTDNGLEFKMGTFYASKGILHQISCMETPQQNGRVERKHQHILGVARALLIQSRLPFKLWAHAIQHVVFLINRVPSSVLKGKISYEVLHGHLPDLSDLKVFGSLCYACTLSGDRSKFASRSRKVFFWLTRMEQKAILSMI